MSLPQEIIDTIVDHLQDDKRSLATCAFLGFDWVYRSRNHLFRTITFQTDRRHNSVTRFLKLIRHSKNRLGVKPFFLDSVRHIRFDQRKQRLGFPLPHPLISSLTCLPYVQTLTVNGGTICTQTAAMLHAVFQSITIITLDDLWYPVNASPADVIFLLGGFPILETLRLKAKFDEATHGDRLPTPNANHNGTFPPGFYIPLSPRLHTLELELSPGSALYPWFSSPHQYLTNIRHLQLNKIRWDEPKYIGPLFTQLGPYLEELELCLPFHEDFNGGICTLDSERTV